MILALCLSIGLAAAASPEEPPPLVKEPALVTFVDAPYPEAAQAAGLEGKVLLAIEIDATGKVAAVTVERAAGYGFDEAAVEAAKQFIFSPAEDTTGPVPVIIEFEYGFVLDVTTRPDAVSAPTSGEPPAPIPTEAPINLEGELREMGTRRPLAAFTLRVSQRGPDGSEVFVAEVETDAQGRYALRGAPPGQLTIRVVRPGYDTLEQQVEVVTGDATDARLWVKNLAYGDVGVVGSYRRETTEITRRTITMEEVRRIPGTFGDPIRVVQSMPGAARSPFGSGLLIIRGSNPQDTGVYVDGIRIPYIYHLGGYESVINPDIVGAVDYLPGGFGVQYGRSTGGAVDARTVEEFPERNKIIASADILDAGAMYSGRLGDRGQHQVGLAARRSYIDLFIPLFISDPELVVKPYWWDYQGKYIYEPKGDHRFSLLVFGFQDILEASTPASTAQGTDTSTQGDLATIYQTHRIVASWEWEFKERWKLDTLFATGRDTASFLLGNDWRLYQGQWVAEVRVDVPYEHNEHFKLVPGIDFLGLIADYTIELPFDPSSLAETDPLAEREPYTLAGDQNAWSPDPYVFAEIRPLEDEERLLISPGLRLSTVIVPGELFSYDWDPRFATRFLVVPKTTVKGSVGLYHQTPQPYQAYRPDDEPIELKLERSLSYTLGFEQELGQAVRADGEVFYKSLSHLIVPNPNFTGLEDEYFLNDGVGRAYGLEVLVRRQSVGRFFGWISYTLSRSERRDYLEEDWYDFDFDQTHILVALAGYKLPRDFQLGGRLQYATGNPTTPYSLGVYDIDTDSYNAFSTGSRNSERLPPYWTVHLRAEKLFTFRAWQLLVYTDLLNVLRGTNPEFEVYNYDYTEHSYIRGLPFIPSLGVEARFEF